MDSVRSISDVSGVLAKLHNIPRLMITVDFEKAFDSINWKFFIEALRSFNFGKLFIR